MCLCSGAGHLEFGFPSLLAPSTSSALSDPTELLQFQGLQRTYNSMFLAMLDMGQRKYGDMTFCKMGSRTFLIDGAHYGDERPIEGGEDADGWKPVPGQLAELVGHEAPFDIDLLIVTHCHSDHIGCLPELVSAGIIKPKWALLADPRMGFGLPLDKPFPNTPLGARQRVTAALREEPLPHTASDEEVRQLIDAAATLQDRYADMIERLKGGGARVVLYGRDPHLLLEQEFADCGFKILGPTIDQLLICALRVECERLRADQRTDAAPLCDGDDEVSLYRALTRGLHHRDGALVSDNEPDGLLEDGGTGAALNNQSIIVRLGHAPDAVLLTGDMQFASPSVGHLAHRMAELHEVVRNAGPYAFTRLSHHGAHNGTNCKFLDYVQECRLFGISTGAGDPNHPSVKTLQLLAERHPQIEWARTDRNGLVALELDGGQADWCLARGELSISDANERTKATATFETTGTSRSSSERAMAVPASKNRLTDIPRLTFLTDVRKLRSRIGQEADAMIDAIAAADHRLLDIREQLAPHEIAQMAHGSSGIVILGGYGVVPAVSVDTIPKDVRRDLKGRIIDSDNYVVWSDDPYGSSDGFIIPEMPVSRIPENVAFGGASATPHLCTPAAGAFGLRNRNRPFASAIFDGVGAGMTMLEAEPTAPADLSHDLLNVEHVYLMLHGYRENPGLFSGEALGEDGECVHFPDAFTLTNIPRVCGATVFAGCCYGAVLVRDEADGWEGGGFDEIGAAESIALSFLRAGARAFVGCTGVHYSPSSPPYKSAAGPLHQYFWDRTKAGLPPAQALREAKLSYFSSMPLDNDPKLLAAEFKTLRQFTCLGLGW